MSSHLYLISGRIHCGWMLETTGQVVQGFNMRHGECLPNLKLVERFPYTMGYKWLQVTIISNKPSGISLISQPINQGMFNSSCCLPHDRMTELNHDWWLPARQRRAGRERSCQQRWGPWNWNPWWFFMISATNMVELTKHHRGFSWDIKMMCNIYIYNI